MLKRLLLGLVIAIVVVGGIAYGTFKGLHDARASRTKTRPPRLRASEKPEGSAVFCAPTKKLTGAVDSPAPVRGRKMRVPLFRAHLNRCALSGLVARWARPKKHSDLAVDQNL